MNQGDGVGRPLAKASLLHAGCEAGASDSPAQSDALDTDRPPGPAQRQTLPFLAVNSGGQSNFSGESGGRDGPRQNRVRIWDLCFWTLTTTRFPVNLPGPRDRAEEGLEAATSDAPSHP